jgi:hypothetical protein
VKDKLAAQLAQATVKKEIEALLHGRAGEGSVKRGVLRVAAMPLPEQKEYVGALWSATRAAGLDDETVAALLRCWIALDDQHGLAEALMHVAARGVAGAHAFVAPFSIAADVLGAALREGIRRELFQQMQERVRAEWGQHDGDDASAGPKPLPVTPSPPTRVVAARAWANDAQRCSAEQGLVHDFECAAGRLGHYEREATRQFIELLAQAPLPAGYVLDAKRAGGLADDIGMSADDEYGWPHLRLLARHLHKLSLTGKTLERILAQLLGVSIRANDRDAVPALLALVPDTVHWEILGYNLACYHAVTGDRAQMLRFVKRSMELGKSPAQFAADSDFDRWRDDPDFVALMKSVE